MILYLLRHGIADERDSEKYPDDSKRPLTEEGIKKFREAAAGAKNLNLEFDLILTSPYTRARQTAELFAKAFKAEKKLKEERALEADASYRNLSRELNKHGEKAGSIVLVGHEPYLSRFLSYLLIGDEQIGIELKKGGLAKITPGDSVEGGGAELNWLLTQKQLREMA